MPLVTPLDPNHDVETKQLSDFYNETLGFCPNSVLTMQRRPEISKAFINLNKAVMANHGRVTSALKRMIAWVSSNATGCRYCQAHAIRAAERYGAEQEQLDNIWEYKTHPAFSDAERAALDFSLAASMVPNMVDEKIKEELYKFWEEGEIVEMLGVISLFGYLNRWNDSMGTSIEDGAVESGEQYLGKHGWNKGKHV
ncbi:carboxymuconolactone decarboxylase family protein [Tenacibaculum larymnensis]|uniref:Carboxymuconolactone decarboxylase family protein n=1 Tax=Tenacibaculum larymnensis TaxID=2878201 RepID=A0A9X4INF7_9FLAO|nr:carboxymuconolactone decarboxylase family protein [Tenacibaculum larymnensis]MDE1205705.1 carboxymuconolactone decarboxylase family protein [Tenacibaculum larymnensis]